MLVDPPRRIEQRRDLLSVFAEYPDPSAMQLGFERPMDFEFMYLLADGLLEKTLDERAPGISVGGVPIGPTRYALTRAGVEFVKRWAAGQPVEG